jgi:hypothetical protein
MAAEVSPAKQIPQRPVTSVALILRADSGRLHCITTVDGEIGMRDYDFNPGILIGGAAAALSVFSALAALYLWAVTRARQRLNSTAAPQERAVIPWLSPLLLPTLVILCLGIVAGLSKAFEEKSWPEPTLVPMAWAAFMILMFWLKLRKKNGRQSPTYISSENAK